MSSRLARGQPAGAEFCLKMRRGDFQLLLPLTRLHLFGRNSCPLPSRHLSPIAATRWPYADGTSVPSSDASATPLLCPRRRPPALTQSDTGCQSGAFVAGMQGGKVLDTGSEGAGWGAGERPAPLAAELPFAAPPAHRSHPDVSLPESRVSVT